jgi:cell division transport system ATP-binding protein
MSDKVVSITNASIFQNKDKLVLSNLNLELKKGEFAYIIGKVGSGKSSLIKTLNAELPLIEGDAKVLGFDLKSIKKSKIPYLRRRIGVVFQDFQLLNDRSVFKNLEFVLKATGWKVKDEIDIRIHKVLEKVDMLNFIHKMPHELSGGEQQRVVIARALLNDPDLILADEPTGNLDDESSKNITYLLHEISKTGKAVLMATHDINQVERYPAQTYICENGRLHKN